MDRDGVLGGRKRQGFDAQQRTHAERMQAPARGESNPCTEAGNARPASGLVPMRV